MENFILYEELGTGSRSVVYKGRRKGSLGYVAIICADKNKRPEITNHVRLCNDLDHQNIVSFNEWYETSNHLWLVMELCTGGSLESVIGQDGCLSEDMVRSFGWDIVKGLKHLHQSGIIYSDLTPAKVLLDGEGVLKLSNFCLSRTEGETLEEFFTMLSLSGQAGGVGGEGDKEISESSLRKRIRGSPVYSAPEVLQGANTSPSSDLWALGCMLYHMYSGNPPFYSDNYNEMVKMITHQEPPPLKQTVSESSPSVEFKSLLKALLNKTPNKRMNWPELLDHPFWAQVKEEEDEEEDEWSEDEEEEDREEGEGDRLDGDDSTSSRFVLVLKCKGNDILCIFSFFSSDNVSDLRPKSADNDNSEAMFLLSTRATPRRSCSIPDPPTQLPAPQVTHTPLNMISDSDTTSCVEALLYTDTDMIVTAVIDNPKILRSPAVRFDPKTLCVPAYSVDKLRSLSDEEWSVFLLQLCSSLEGKAAPPPPLPASSSSSAPPPPPPPSAAVRSRINLLGYLCCAAVAQGDVATRLINSPLLPGLTHQLHQAPNWDVRSKVLRVIGLLAQHCTILSEETPVSEVVCAITDLLRDNLRNNKAKLCLLPPLGELLYRIASQEKKKKKKKKERRRGDSPEAVWFVPAAAYTGLMRSLREGDDVVVQHMAAKTIENIATTITDSAHSLVTAETGPALWYLFTHSTVEAVRITAISALSRLTRCIPGVFLAVIDSCGPAAMFEGQGVAPPRVQQHLLTATAAALLGSHTHTHRLAQEKEVVLKVLRCLESPSTLTRAKALLLLLLLLQDNTQTLMYCCQHRLVMYLERDLRKATPLRENTNQSQYLSQCLGLTVVYLTRTVPLILEKVLSALGGVVGRRHPPPAQSKNLKNTLPSLSIVLDLLSSQVFRSHIVSENFLEKIGMLLNYFTSVESSESDMTSAVGAAAYEEMIRTTLSILEVMSEHPAVINTHHSAVMKAVLPSLVSLAFSRNAEWCACVLRVLSELCPLLLAPEGPGTWVEEEEEEEEEEEGAMVAQCPVREEERDDEEEVGGGARPGASQEADKVKLLALLAGSLFPRYGSFLSTAEPIPLYALKLLVAVTEHNPEICRLIKQSEILPSVLQLITVNSTNVNGVLVQTGVALLCNLSSSGGPEQDLEPLYRQGLIEVVVTVLREAALRYLEEDGQPGSKDGGHLALLSYLELLQIILRHMSAVVRSALQSQRLSCPATESDSAEKLLLANRPLNRLNTHLILLLSTKDQEVGEESVQCLSLLVQLYGGGEEPDCLTPECLHSFLGVLLSDTPPGTQRTTLRVLRRLVQTSDGRGWLECSEGAELVSLLQDLADSSRSHNEGVAVQAAEILQEIHAL
ncbi:unnamed protein product [Lota lota]